MSAQPTERDRERAAEVLFGMSGDHGVLTPHNANQIRRVAQALADERARARAVFLALAEELGTLPGLYEREYVADRIRAAAQEPSSTRQWVACVTCLRTYEQGHTETCPQADDDTAQEPS